MSAVKLPHAIDEKLGELSQQVRKLWLYRGVSWFALVFFGSALGLVLLDGAKVLYPRILALLEPRLAKGALVLADNADMSAEYRARVRDGGRYLAAPVSEEVELAMWLG